VHHPLRRGAAFRVPLPETTFRICRVFGLNRIVSCGSLKRVPRHMAWHVYGASRLSALKRGAMNGSLYRLHDRI
jgi:hypothetical protein